MGLDFSGIGLLLLVLCSIGSFLLGRYVSRHWRARRRARQEAEGRARETRQQRRARERRERLR